MDLALKRIFNNKSELLLVLKRPDIPLHNNLSENDIREFVKKRKISGPIRSLSGQVEVCQDKLVGIHSQALRKFAENQGGLFLGVSFGSY